MSAVENDDETVLAAKTLDDLGNGSIQRSLSIVGGDPIRPDIVVESAAEHVLQLRYFLVETGTEIMVSPGDKKYIYFSVPLRPKGLVR